MKKALLVLLLGSLWACSDADSRSDGLPPAADSTVPARDGGISDRGPTSDASSASDGVPISDLASGADLAPGVDAAPSQRGWPLNTGFIVAVDSAEGGAILATKDAYLLATSAFDRSFLTQTVGDVSVDQLATHLGAAALDWSSAERTRLQGVVASIHQRMQGYKLPFPQQMFLIKGGHFQPSHTRGAAIYVGSEGLSAGDGQLEELLVHELWHILSRNAPGVREDVYAVIDYHDCGVVQRPPEIVDLWLTNPDALYRYCVKLSYQSYDYDFMPVTFATGAFTANTGANLSTVMGFGFLGVQAGATESVPLYENGGAGALFLLTGQSLQSLMQAHTQKVGSNTDYIIHPDEIIADNFADLILGTQNLPSPQIIQGIDAVLSAL